MAPLVLAALVGGMLGSIPTAYLLVKRRHGLDVAAEGSGNVGANNAMRASGSRWTGVLVLLGDALKGVAAVASGAILFDVLLPSGLGSYLNTPLDVQLDPPLWLPWWCESVALLGAIAGHNYNPWLSLKAGRLVGGKGLATAAGGFALLLPWLLAVWIAGFAIGFYGFAARRGVRDVLPGNVVGTLVVPFAAWELYGSGAALVVTCFALLVLPKHVAQLRALLGAPLPPTAAP